MTSRIRQPIALVALLVVASMGLAIVAANTRDTTPENQPAATTTTASAAVGGLTGTPTTTSAAEGNTPTETAAPEGAPPATATPTPPAAATPTAALPTGADAPTPEPEATPAPLIERPVRLRIPALGIDTVVQWVGLDDERRMATPSNYTDTAWLEHGPPPGASGNSVIAGHLDSTTGPAVFYRLGDLVPGDEVFVVASDGTEYRFVVESSEAYQVDAAPLDRIFGPADSPRLNLITCSGRFDRSAREYDERLVVYTRREG